MESEPNPEVKLLLTKEERNDFMSLFPNLVQDITESDPQFRELSEINRWLEKVLNYNVPYGKRTR